MKKILLLNALITLIVCSIAAAAINFRADRSIDKIIEAQRKNVHRQTDDKVKAFDSSFYLISEEIKKRAENAVYIINERLKNGEPDMAVLEQWAAELGVGDIFLINESGVIYNTSNRREQGFNIRKAGTTVNRFINNYLGKGVFVHEGLSVGMISGRTTTYSYYSPEGTNYIIETAIYIEDFITETYGSDLYTYLFNDYFKDVLSSYRYVESIDLFSRVRASAVSILNTGSELPLNDAHAEQLMKGETLIIENNGKYSEYRTVSYTDEENRVKIYLLETVYNFSTAGREIKHLTGFTIKAVYAAGFILMLLAAIISGRYGRSAAIPPSSKPERPKDITGNPPAFTGLFPEQLPFTGRILLVDDSEYNKFVIESYLAETGMEIVYTDNGNEALSLFAENKYDLVLTDIQMPDMDGYKLAEEIRGLEKSTGMKRTPIIAITAFNLERDADKCIDAGCDAHVAKPINKDTLLKTVYAYCTMAGGLNMDAEAFLPHEGVISIEVKPEFKEITPLFLRDLQNLKARVADLLDKGDYDSIQFIGHRLKGEAECFGFAPVSDYGLFLQGAAIRANREKTEQIIDLVNDYASRVRLID